MFPTQYLSYDQVALIPKLSKLTSRSQADVSVQFGPKKFKLPVMPANMKCTIDWALAKWMSENDYFYVMHRFGNNYTFLLATKQENWKNVSISIGVKAEDIALLSWAVENTKIDYITIDIAHGHCIAVKEMITFIHQLYDSRKIQRPFIIAGNVASAEAVNDLAEWGADAAKVGIAQGGACTTYGKTGFGLPMFTCVEECVLQDDLDLSDLLKPSNEDKTERTIIPVIADGGIKTNGDIAKALVAGAKMIMAGSMFAACKDSPADALYYGITLDEKPRYKIYYGSASATNKGNNHHIEGTEVQIPISDFTYETKLLEITEDLQSAVSYAGGNNLNAFKTVSWVQR
jgi:GMP reductase